MHNKSNVIYIHTKEEQKRYKRKRILRKRIKCACTITGIMAFFFLLGVAGGVEQGIMPMGRAIIYSIISLGVFGASIEIGGRL